MLLICIAVGAIIFGTKTFFNQKISKYDKLINEGTECLKSGNLEEAQSNFEKAGEINSDDPAYVIGNANVYYKQGNYDFCLEYLIDYSNKNNKIIDNPEYNFVMGNAYYKQENWTGAIEYFSKTVDLASQDENYNDRINEFKADLAKAYVKDNQIEKAQEIINSIPDGNDDYINYINCEIDEASNNISSAISGYKNIINTTKNENIKSECYISIANIYKNRNNFNEEINILIEATNNLQGGSNLVVKEMLGEAYYKNGEYTSSANIFNELLEAGYTRPYIYLDIAYAYQQSGDLVSAENVLIQMEEKYPSEYRCYVQLAYVYIESEGNKS